MNAIVAEILLLGLLFGSAVWIMEQMQATGKPEPFSWCEDYKTVPGSCDGGAPVVYEQQDGSYKWCHPLLYKTGQDLSPGALACVPVAIERAADGAVSFAGRVVEKAL